MLKLVRLALTAAILAAIAVRLRRRARMPAKQPEPPAPSPRRARSLRMVMVWAAIAAIVALTLVAALLPADDGAAQRAFEVRQEALSEVRRVTVTPSPAPVQTPVPTPAEIPDANCSPAPRPVAVRPIDPKVKRAVDRQWVRLERWLKANAPRTYRTLGAPGRARTIAIAESQMGVDFPDDLRASLLRHNGARGARAFGFGAWFGAASNLSVREIRDTWRWHCSWDDTDLGPDPSIEFWNGRMIPFLSFAGRDGEGSEYAVVDSVDGAVGWDDTIGGMAPRVSSYYALMRAVADALERGEEFDGWRPAVTRGVLRWEKADEGEL